MQNLQRALLWRYGVHGHLCTKNRPIRPDVISLCKIKPRLTTPCCRLPEDRSSALAVKPRVSALASNVVHRRWQAGKPAAFTVGRVLAHAALRAVSAVQRPRLFTVNRLEKRGQKWLQMPDALGPLRRWASFLGHFVVREYVAPSHGLLDILTATCLLINWCD